jgi:hypothetical protein
MRGADGVAISRCSLPSPAGVRREGFHLSSARWLLGHRSKPGFNDINKGSVLKDRLRFQHFLYLWNDREPGIHNVNCVQIGLSCGHQRRPKCINITKTNFTVIIKLKYVIKRFISRTILIQFNKILIDYFHIMFC